VSATLPQIGSRLFLTWGILWSFPEVLSTSKCSYFLHDILSVGIYNDLVLQTRAHILVTTLVISWSITEVLIS
jgi:very-long-chain (3R)-3-hydroxyacyl-CoA dehydratase